MPVLVHAPHLPSSGERAGSRLTVGPVLGDDLSRPARLDSGRAARAAARRARRVPEGPKAAVIATVRSDGAPYTAATWYEWDDGRILVNMDFERLRLKHMRRDERVAVTVIDLEDWYRAVTVLGRVVELRDDEGLVDIDRLSQRYRGTPYWNRERMRVTALIEPERWHEHS